MLTWCYLFFQILQNEIWEFSLNYCLWPHLALKGLKPAYDRREKIKLPMLMKRKRTKSELLVWKKCNILSILIGKEQGNIF